MSLKLFLKQPEIRNRFKDEFVLPPLNGNGELAVPINADARLVGTAFDYLLRFYCERLNPGAKSQEWVAWSATTRFPAAEELLDNAEKSYQRYLQNGNVDDRLLQSVIDLARLDVPVRRQVEDSYFNTLGTRDPMAFEDLRRLLALVRPEWFRATDLCILNPTFGPASELVSGADADLVIDNALIEVKTTKDFRMQREHFNQLLGYYTLYRIGGIEGAPKNHSIDRVGVYFSCYGCLRFFELGPIIKEERFDDFVDWFTQRAQQQALCL